MEHSSYILDGELKQDSALRLSPFDLGLSQGIGCFETLWAAAGASPFAAQDHHQRLRLSCRKFQLPCPTLEELLSQTHQLRQVLQLETQETRIRWTLWQASAQQTHCLITARHAQTPSHAARVQLSSHRLHSQAPLAGHKTSSYAAFALMLREAQQAGFDETAYCNEHAHLVEGSTSNLFFLRQDGQKIHLHTPPLSSGCLPGVTRARVLQLAASDEFAEIAIDQNPLTANDLPYFQAAFLTNSQVGLRSMSQLGDQQFAPSLPVLIKLRERFTQLRLEQENDS